MPTECLRHLASGGGDLFGLLDHDLGLFDRGDVDQPAVDRSRHARLAALFRVIAEIEAASFDKALDARSEHAPAYRDAETRASRTEPVIPDEAAAIRVLT